MVDMTWTLYAAPICDGTGLPRIVKEMGWISLGSWGETEFDGLKRCEIKWELWIWSWGCEMGFEMLVESLTRELLALLTLPQCSRRGDYSDCCFILRFGLWRGRMEMSEFWDQECFWTIKLGVMWICRKYLIVMSVLNRLWMDWRGAMRAWRNEGCSFGMRSG